MDWARATEAGEGPKLACIKKRWAWGSVMLALPTARLVAEGLLPLPEPLLMLGVGLGEPPPPPPHPPSAPKVSTSAGSREGSRRTWVCIPVVSARQAVG